MKYITSLLDFYRFTLHSRFEFLHWLNLRGDHAADFQQSVFKPKPPTAAKHPKRPFKVPPNPSQLSSALSGKLRHKLSQILHVAMCRSSRATACRAHFGECFCEKIVIARLAASFFLTARQRAHTLSHTLAGGYILVHHTIDGWLFLRAGYRERGGLPACPLACLLARLAGWRLYAAIALCAHYAARRVCINVHIPANTYSPVQSYVPRLCSVCVCVCVPSYNVLLYFILYRKGGAKEERESREEQTKNTEEGKKSRERGGKINFISDPERAQSSARVPYAPMLS
jgi:hypothetical protein